MKVDLRRLGKKEISYELMAEIVNEIETLTNDNVRISRFNRENHTFTLTGTTTLYDKFNSQMKVSDNWKIKDYIKLLRAYDKKYKQVTRERERLLLPTHDIIKPEELIVRKSKGQAKIRGLENALETATKIMTKDKITGRNRLEETFTNYDRLIKARYQAYDNPLAIMKVDDPKFNIKDYQWGTGRFKSKKKEREFYRKFAKALQEENFIDSLPPGSEAELVTNIYESFVPMDMTSREYLSSITDEELVRIIREVEDERTLSLIEDYRERNIEEDDMSNLLTLLTQYSEEFDYKLGQEDDFLKDVEKKLKNRGK